MCVSGSWAVYDDSLNYILDEKDWWVAPDASLPTRQCTSGPFLDSTDANDPTTCSAFPQGTRAASPTACCEVCGNISDCIAWVYEDDNAATNDVNCWPLSNMDGTKPGSHRILGQIGSRVAAQNGDLLDLYGFFHGHDYTGALNDFVQVSGKAIMVPKSASGSFSLLHPFI